MIESLTWKILPKMAFCVEAPLVIRKRGDSFGALGSRQISPFGPPQLWPLSISGYGVEFAEIEQALLALFTLEVGPDIQLEPAGWWLRYLGGIPSQPTIRLWHDFAKADSRPSEKLLDAEIDFVNRLEQR